MLTLQTPEDFLPKITTTYNITNCLAFPIKGINHLTQKERSILVMLYMQDEEMFDYEIYVGNGSQPKEFIDWPLL